MTGFENDIKNCLEVLNKGGLILYPTDTIWGIGCDATNKNAVAKIYSLKKRSDNKSMIILVANEKEITRYTEEANPKIFEYLSSANKPTTVIYGCAKNIAQNLVSSDGSVAIREVKDEFCKNLISGFKKPVVSTSANVSGEPYPRSFDEISSHIKNGVDYIVQHRKHDIMHAQPSSIVKLNDKGKIEVLRS